MSRKQSYEMAIRIAGEIEKSFPNAVKLSKAELRAIAKESQIAAKSMNMNFSDGLDKTSKMFSKIEKMGAKAFKAIATSAGTAAAAVGTFSVKTGAEFDSQISTVKAISGANKKNTEALRNEAKSLGANSVFTATEVGQAMEYEARAGWRTEDMLAGTKGIMNATSADGGDLATVSDIITDNLTAFKKTAKEAEKMADVLAATSASSNTDIEKMGETFKYVAPVASDYDYEDVALYTGLMANAGIKSSMSGTAQRGLIKRIAKPTKESSIAIKKLGLTKEVTEGNDYDKLMQSIVSGMKKYSSAEQKKIAAMLAGSSGMSGLMAIVNTPEQDYKKLKKAIDESKGAAEEMSKVRLDNLEGDVTLFKSAMEGAGIEIYDELKEPLRGLVQGATEWIGDFSESFQTGFPTAVREIKEAGEAIADFSEPLLEVGEWCLDNPQVIAGAIGGIGTAVAGHKVASGVSNLTDSLKGLGKGGIAALAVTGAVGVIGGVCTAYATMNKEAKQASLDKHFGDVALSMEDIQSAAENIVGKGELKAVGELFSSMDDVEKVADEMKSASKEISAMDWKVSVGMKISKEDVSDYEKSVSEYVSSAQDLIDKKGYEINIATNLLFDDTSTANELINDNNAFYKKLDTETSQLSKKINNKLEKAVKDGLTPDLQEEINSLLGEISKIQNAMTDAENEASWDMMEAEWSGKDLDADSFKNLATEVQANVDELNSGADSAYKESLTNLRAQKKLDYITDEEYKQKKKEYEDAYQQTKAEAKERGVEFLYNTMMDTYGDKLANGGYEKGDINAINDMMALIKEMNPEGEIKEMTDQWDIMYKRVGTDGWINNNAWYLFQDILTGIDNGEQYTTNLDNANKNIKVMANEYINPSKDGDSKIAKSLQENTQKSFDANPLKFGKFIKEPAKEAVSDTIGDIKQNIKNFAESGLSVNLPIKLFGSYIMETKGTNEILNSSSKGSNGVLEKVKPYAEGGIATEPTILVAEAGIPEMVIPIERTPHSIDLWKQTGELLGVQSSPVPTFSELWGEMSKYNVNPAGGSINNKEKPPINITFAPQITIQGNADKKIIHDAMTNEYKRFEQLMNQYMNKNRRVSLS